MEFSPEFVFQQITQPPPQSGFALKDFLPFATTFLGALAAFGLAWLKEYRAERKRQHLALLESQYALFNRWNTLEGAKRQCLNKYEMFPDRHLKLDFQMTMIEGEPLVIPFDALGFLIRSDKPMLLQELHLVHTNYLNLVGVFKRYEEARRAFGFTRSGDPAKSYEEADLKSLTNAMYKDVGPLQEQIKRCRTMLEVYLNAKFKGEKVLGKINEYPESKSNQITPQKETSSPNA